MTRSEPDRPQGRKRQRRAGETEPSSEGGRTWRQQPGYGERVLRNGPAAAEEEAEHLEEADRPRRPEPEPDVEPLTEPEAERPPEPDE